VTATPAFSALIFLRSAAADRHQHQPSRGLSGAFAFEADLDAGLGGFPRLFA
jgi:hypothetical protein